MSMETPIKPGHLTLDLQQENNENKVNGVNVVNSMSNGILERSPAQPGFLVSFLVDARGASMRGKRHSGIDLIIPPSKVCMPTRITCKLVKKSKLQNPPMLREGEALASRIAELGPVGEKFVGPVLIELPHFASRTDAERELIVLRSDTGVSWHEHSSATPSDSFNKLIAAESSRDGQEKRVVRIFTADFPRYFVAVTRIRQDTRTIGLSGGAVTSSVSQAVVNFPERAINKDIKVSLQVLPISAENILRAVGEPVATSVVATIEPRRRKFHAPITLTIPVPKEIQENIRKQKKDAGPAVTILYSITGGNAPSQWEDITGSAPLNLSKDTVSFSTIVSARYWLMDCGRFSNPTKLAAEIFQDSVAAPFLAKFFVLAKCHSTSEVQVRILCLTDDDVESTFERQEHFQVIGQSKDIEVFEGKSYYLDVAGNFAPVAATSRELYITFNSFRVNRLSFVARIRDLSQPPTGQLFLNKDSVVPTGKTPEAPVFRLDVTLPEFDAGLLSPDLEPEKWKAKFEAAKSNAAAVDKPLIGPALKLTDIAEALQGDWVSLASQLGLSQREIVKIQTEYGSLVEQAILMLHLWVEKMGSRATGSQLASALRRIGRNDVIDQCIDNKTDQEPVHNDDLDALNSIDLTFANQDGSFSFFDGSHHENYPVNADVDEGVVYEIEEVWDGSQWHKTRKAVPKLREPTVPEPDESTVPIPIPMPELAVPKPDDLAMPKPDESEVPKPDESEVRKPDELAVPKPDESAVPKPDESEVPKPDESAVPKPDESAVSKPDESVIQKPDESAVLIPDESAVLKPDESAVLKPDESTVQKADEWTVPDLGQSKVPAPDVPRPDDFVREYINEKEFDSPQNEQHFSPVLETLSTIVADGEPARDIVHSEPSYRLEAVNQATAQEPSGNQFTSPAYEFQSESTIVSAQTLADEPVATTTEVPPANIETGTPFEADNYIIREPVDLGDVRTTSTDVSYGEPKVTTKVEEYEETLPDGTIVKRKVIKTKQEQMTSQTTTAVEGGGGAGGAYGSDSATFERMLTNEYSSDGDAVPNANTTVKENEETLEDGTVVKRRVIKTTQCHVETANQDG